MTDEQRAARLCNTFKAAHPRGDKAPAYADLSPAVQAAWLAAMRTLVPADGDYTLTVEGQPGTLTRANDVRPVLADLENVAETFAGVLEAQPGSLNPVLTSDATRTLLTVLADTIALLGAIVEEVEAEPRALPLVTVSVHDETGCGWWLTTGEDGSITVPLEAMLIARPPVEGCEECASPGVGDCAVCGREFPDAVAP